jgi:hypothetical protein
MVALFAASVLGLAPTTFAQASLVGEWEGTLDANGTQVHILWHVTAAADGTVTSTFDNQDEGVNGIKAKFAEFSGSKLTLTVDDQVEINGSTVNVRGTFVGTVSKEGNEVTGTWTQTDPEQPPADIDFKRHVEKPAPAAAAPKTPDSDSISRE